MTHEHNMKHFKALKCLSLLEACTSLSLNLWPASTMLEHQWAETRGGIRQRLAASRHVSTNKKEETKGTPTRGNQSSPKQFFVWLVCLLLLESYHRQGFWMWKSRPILTYSEQNWKLNSFFPGRWFPKEMVWVVEVHGQSSLATGLLHAWCEQGMAASTVQHLAEQACLYILGGLMICP